MISTKIDVQDGVPAAAAVTVNYLSGGCAEVLVSVGEDGELSVNVSTSKGRKTCVSVDDIDVLE